MAQLKRMEIEFNGSNYNFAINPEEYTQAEPNKASVIQTLGGAFVDQFGAGLIEISFKGTTGYKNGTNDGNNGFEKFKELRDMIRENYNNTDNSKVMKFYNYTDEEYWYVFVERFSLSRSKSRSLLFQYDIKFIGIRKLSDTQGTSTGKIGSSYSVKKTASIDEGGYSGNYNYENDSNVKSSSISTKNTDMSYKTKETIGAVLNNLSVQVAGHNGLFSPMITKYISSNLSVLETGEIPNVPLDTNMQRGVSINDNAFIPKLSRSATMLLKDLKEFDASVIEVNKFIPLIDKMTLEQANTHDFLQIVSLILNKTGSAVDSILVDAIKFDKIEIVQVKQLKIILLETMNLYYQIFKIATGKLKELDMSEKDIERLFSNINYVISRLEKSNVVAYNTISELRKLYQNVKHISVTPDLF